jgi:hypothetical protein
MLRQLTVPPGVASSVREFATHTPPLSFLERGHLVLVVEESEALEWHKRLVFRKIE